MDNSGVLNIGNEGCIVDYLVKMMGLAEENMLDQAIKHYIVSEELPQPVLLAFYRSYRITNFGFTILSGVAEVGYDGGNTMG